MHYHEDNFQSDRMIAEIMATSGCDYEEARYQTKCEIRRERWDNASAVDEIEGMEGMSVFEM